MASENVRLDLPLVLPGDADACESCVRSLAAALRGHPAITGVELAQDPRGVAQLSVAFDPSGVGVGQIKAFVAQAGAAISDRFGHFAFSLPTATHARRARSLAADLRSEPGVLQAEISPAGHGFVEFDREKTSKARMKAVLKRDGVVVLDAVVPAGPERPAKRPSRRRRLSPARRSIPTMTITMAHQEKAQARSHAGHGHSHRGVLGERAELIFAITAGLALGAGWLSSFVAPPAVPLGLYLASYAFGSWFTLREALENLRRRRLEIDSLMLVAAAGAAALGEWAEGALLLVLFSLGHALEHYAMGRARRAIEALAELAPETATRKRDAALEDVPIEHLRVGDVVVVRPNQRLPADGLVVAGESSVNQAPVTGESVPVDKRPAPSGARFEKASSEHRVFAGTINGAGALEVSVARRAEESTLARVVTMVAEAESQRSPTQRFTDRFERVFVPAVLVGSAGLMLAWLVVDEPFSVSFYRAMAVLVAASPCALAISVPGAVLSGVARAGRGGVLVKGGGPLENLGSLTFIAFDKTGTLTEGKPRVTDVVPAIGVTREELLRAAVAVEQLSDHPLAAAVVRAGEELLPSGPIGKAEAVESLTGQGVRGRVDGEEVLLGKPALFDDQSKTPLPELVRADAERLAREGRTVMVVRRGDAYLGVLGLLDTPREAAADVIRRLRALGLKRIVMLSGDNQGVADAIAGRLGLDEARGGLMPEDKVRIVKAMRQSEGRVAMVGDGVNDAPAMANATVGIAMGAAGSDVALETADVALMADDLRHLPFAVGLSRETSRIIKQNLWTSLGMVAFLIPATLFGLKIGAAVMFHEGSTLLVVANALRLLAYKDPGR